MNIFLYLKVESTNTCRFSVDFDSNAGVGAANYFDYGSSWLGMIDSDFMYSLNFTSGINYDLSCRPKLNICEWIAYDQPSVQLPGQYIGRTDYCRCTSSLGSDYLDS